MPVSPSYLPPTAPFPFLQAVQYCFIKTFTSNLKAHVPDHPSNSKFFHKNHRNGKDLWRSLVLPPALTRTIANISLWLCIYESWKYPRMESIQHVWWPAPMLPIIPEKIFLICLNLPRYNQWPLPLCPLVLLRRPWIHLFNYPPSSCKQLLGDLSLSLLSIRTNKSDSLNLFLEVMPNSASPWLCW